MLESNQLFYRGRVRATSALIAKSKFAECVFRYGCAGGVRTLDPQLMRLVSYLLLYRAWCQKVVSNHSPMGYESIALPTELFWHKREVEDLLCYHLF